MLIKRKDQAAKASRLQAVSAGLASGALDRRTFLRRSGLAAGGVAALGAGTLGSVRKAEAIGVMDHAKKADLKKNMCTHCSVGCSIVGEIQNGVWVGQEPAWDSPINRGTHCANWRNGCRG